MGPPRYGSRMGGSVKVREAPAAEVSARCAVDPARISVGLLLEDAEGGLAFSREAFDSDVLGLEIGRVVEAWGPSAEAHLALLGELVTRARGLGYDQVLRRVPIRHLAEVWALERSGFELMDVGLTFARRTRGPVQPPAHQDLVVRPATAEDVEQIVEGMATLNWGSRFESDPAYPADRVRDLRARWLRNSLGGRADAFLVGEIDGRTAGYVTCLVDAAERIGDIDLVGTLPEFRRRGVASRVVEHAVAWFSTRVDLVLVRTQATNFAAAALYERAGFTLFASDLTLRLSLD